LFAEQFTVTGNVSPDAGVTVMVLVDVFVRAKVSAEVEDQHTGIA
jgi:hypothetical protein